MEKVELIVTLEAEKIKALSYALSDKGGGTVQKELEKRVAQMYEELVEPGVRGYIDYVIASQAPRSHAKKPSKPAAEKAPAAASENREAKHEQSQ